MNNSPIGFFDSGLGGLTCIPTLRHILPNEKIVYFGDTARTPYGSKSAETIKKFAFQISDYLAGFNVKMIVIACNTISATCVDELQARHPSIPVIGIISPMVEKILQEYEDNTTIGIIGTRATVNSRTYSNLILKENKNVKMYSKACPLFVPIIEEGMEKSEILNLTIKHYLDDFIYENYIDKLVLGCTHYPIIKDRIKEIYPNVELLNPSSEVIYKVKKILTETNSLAEKNDAINRCYASDLSPNFIGLVEKVFGKNEEVKISFKQFDE